jgi:hypothetical protein
MWAVSTLPCLTCKGAKTFGTMKLSTIDLLVTLSLSYYAESRFDECRILFIIMLNVTTLSVIIVSVEAPL